MRVDANMNFDLFQAALEDLCKQFKRRKVSKLIERLNSSFRHVRSFTNAITSGAQAHMMASLIWCGAQAVIEVRCVAWRPTGWESY